MALDALIVADYGSESFSGTNPLKLYIDGRLADIQTVMNLVQNHGRLSPPIVGEGRLSWSSSPKLNGIHLFSYLARQGLDVAVVDDFSADKEKVRRLLREAPRAVVISTTFITRKQALVEMVREIRALSDDVKIIIGGPFVYTSYLIYQRSRAETGYLPEEAGQDFLFIENDGQPEADLFIMASQGEDILSRALRRIKRREDIGDLPNTAVFKDGAIAFGVRSEAVILQNHSIDWERLPDEVFRSGVVPLQASSGCPYHCGFCNFVKDRRLTAVKPLDQLLTEMRQVRARGARYVWFVDDNFRLGKGDLEGVCERLIQEDLGLRWMTFIRASTLDAVDPDLLRRAGCVEVQLGLESADPQVLRNMNKRATPELYDRVLPKLLASGINCSCYLIFGFPGETEESARRTIDFMRRHEAARHPGSLSWSIFPFLLAPLSPIYEKEARAVYALSGYMKKWRHATMDDEQAMGYVIRAFLDMEHSGAIYRDDNQDLLSGLDPHRRQCFIGVRHALSKAAMQSELTLEALQEAFQPLFE